MSLVQRDEDRCSVENVQIRVPRVQVQINEFRRAKCGKSNSYTQLIKDYDLSGSTIHLIIYFWKDILSKDTVHF